MLALQDNELITRVGPGTPMGALMRQYWIPALISDELAERDGAPYRVRLLGEDLVAFRDSDGNVGLLGANCPHRGASLFFGRNEERGIRCVYHGWKFDTTGACVDMPSEPAESNFKHKVQATAYPCREQGGIVWAYLGNAAELPPLPAFMANALPPAHIRHGRRYQETNYLQALEGGIDSAHASFLHARLQPREGGGLLDVARAHSGAVALQVQQLDNGLLIGAQRELPDGNDYWRTNLFLMPFYTESPGDTRGHFNAWVPMDDETTLRVSVVWDPVNEITDEALAEQARRTGNRQGLPGGFIAPQDLLPPTTEAGGHWRARANKTNDYRIDRELYKTERFFGVDGGNIGTQDLAVQESMGPIMDRRREHLGTTDLGVIATRRMLLQAAVALRDHGATPPGVDEPDSYAVHAVGFTAPRDADWSRIAQEHMVSQPGVERLNA